MEQNTFVGAGNGQQDGALMLDLVESDGVPYTGRKAGQVPLDPDDAADREKLFRVHEQLAQAITSQLRGYILPELTNRRDIADGLRNQIPVRIKGLPKHYQMMKKVNASNKSTRVDFYIAGHPTGRTFKSVRTFGIHVVWLATKRSGDCACELCNWKTIRPSKAVDKPVEGESRNPSLPLSEQSSGQSLSSCQHRTAVACRPLLIYYAFFFSHRQQSNHVPAEKKE